MIEEGYYWVRVTSPICDSGGVVDEHQGPREIARYEGCHWYITGVDGWLADQYTVEVESRVADL